MYRHINLNNRKSKNKKGFTLIELIVVIAIIAIIAAVAVPKITVMMDAAKEAAAIENLKSLRLAVLTLVEENPNFGLKKVSGSDYVIIADAIAGALGKTAEARPGVQNTYYIPDIELPMAATWNFKYETTTVSGKNETRLYLYLHSVPVAEGDKIGVALGLGKPTFNKVAGTIKKNEYIFWGGTAPAPKPGLNILLYVFDF